MKRIICLFKRNKSIIKTALPIFLELILTILIGNMDQFMISSDQVAVNAIIQANTVLNVMLITFSVLSTASIILICEYRGAKDEKTKNKIYALSFYFNLILSVFVSLVLVFLARPIFKMMQVDEDVIDDACEYMQIVGSFIVFQAMITTFGAFLRADRLNNESTIIAFVMNILNIGLNALFLYVFDMGIKGVAIATDISRFVGLLGVIFFYIKKIGVSLSPRMLTPFPAHLLRKLLRIGLPSAGENFSYNLSQSVIQIIINLSGVLQGNVRGYAANIVMVVYLFANGITQAMQVEEGEYIGKGQIKEADSLVKDTVKMSMIVSLLMSIVLLCLSYTLFSWLMGTSTDPVEAIKLGVIVFAIDLVLEQGRAGNIVLVRGLQTAGDINYPVILSIIFCWSVAVGGTYLLGHVLGLGVIGCWIAMCLDECIRSAIFIVRWKKGKWKGLSLIKEDAKKLS